MEHGTQPSAGPVEMAVLVEGQKFGLSSKSDTCKSVVYVKLTDSALRSLEDYLKHRVSNFSTIFYIPLRDFWNLCSKQQLIGGGSLVVSNEVTERLGLVGLTFGKNSEN